MRIRPDGEVIWRVLSSYVLGQSRLESIQQPLRCIASRRVDGGIRYGLISRQGLIKITTRMLGTPVTLHYFDCLIRAVGLTVFQSSHFSSDRVFER